MFFCKKSFYVGNSMTEFNRLRTILEENNIKYSYSVMDREGSFIAPGRGVGRSVMGLSNHHDEKIYKLEINKKDYEIAKAFLR